MTRASWRVAASAGLALALAGCHQPLKVGAIAPEFSGLTDEGKTFRLSELKGKSAVVLYFYPKDETAGYIIQACAFRDRIEKLHARGYTVVGISCNSVDSHKQFKAKYGLPFTLIADTDGAIARRFGVPVERKMLGAEPTLLADRQTFVIDKDGRITRQFKVKDPEQHVRKTFDALQVPW